MRAIASPETKEFQSPEQTGKPWTKDGVSRAEKALSPAAAVSPEARPRSPVRPGRLAGASLLLILCVGLWSLSHRSPRTSSAVPGPAPVPGSVADDEPHSFARTRADYARWLRQMEGWFAEGDPEIRTARKLDPVEERTALPPIEAARACLQRHLQKLVTIDALEPIGYERAGEDVAIDYRAVVRSRIDLYVVAAVPQPVPNDQPEGIRRIWPYLLLDPQLPPGCAHVFDDKHLLLKANEPLAFRWRIERARIVDGRWKILLASPSLLEWNCAFVAAEILTIREGDPFALRIAGNRCIQPFALAYNEAIANLIFEYDWLWGVPGAKPIAFAARAEAMLRGSAPRIFSSQAPLIPREAAPALSPRGLTLPGYAATTDWAEPILAPIRRLPPQTLEDRWIDRQRRMAEDRNRWIDAFVLQWARSEDQRGQALLSR